MMNNIDEIVAAATAAIENEFFKLPIDGGNPVWRERVYCYELYHQMRGRWPQYGEYRLNGEVDKGGHPKLREVEADQCKPDLLIHIPGAMAGNLVVFEVKPCNARLKDIRKDLQTLQLFTTGVGYQRGIYLIYGDDCDRVLAKVATLMEVMQVNDRVEIWTHRAVGAPATRWQP